MCMAPFAAIKYALVDLIALQKQMPFEESIAAVKGDTINSQINKYFGIFD